MLRACITVGLRPEHWRFIARYCLDDDETTDGGGDGDGDDVDRNLA